MSPEQLEDAWRFEQDRADRLEAELELYKIAIFKLSACRFAQGPAIVQQMDLVIRKLHDDLEVFSRDGGAVSAGSDR